MTTFLPERPHRRGRPPPWAESPVPPPAARGFPLGQFAGSSVVTRSSQASHGRDGKDQSQAGVGRQVVLFPGDSTGTAQPKGCVRLTSELKPDCDSTVRASCPGRSEVIPPRHSWFRAAPRQTSTQPHLVHASIAVMDTSDRLGQDEVVAPQASRGCAGVSLAYRAAPGRPSSNRAARPRHL